MNDTRPPLIVQIPAGDLGALHALAAMRVAANRLAGRPELAKLAKAMYIPQIDSRPGYVGAKVDARVVASGIFAELRYIYRFAADPAGIELQRDHLAQVRGLLDYPHAPALGDCDDRAVIIAALLGLRGIPNRFVLASKGPREPFCHVYAAALLDNIFPVDPQEADAPGIDPPGIVRRYVEGFTLPQLLDSNGDPIAL